MHRLLVILPFISVDEIIWFYHSNETSLAQLLYTTIHFFEFCQKEFECFVNFFFCRYSKKGLSDLQSLTQETEEISGYRHLAVYQRETS